MEIYFSLVVKIQFRECKGYNKNEGKTVRVMISGVLASIIICENLKA